jgi:hypothetical protein
MDRSILAAVETEQTESANGAQSGHVSDADILAELEQLSSNKAADKQAAPVADDEDSEAEAVEAKADETEDEQTQTESDDEDADDDEESSDPEVAKRLRIVRRNEQRASERLSAREAELDRREKSISQDVEALREFQSLKSRARYDRVGVLKALGVTDDMFEDVAREFYANSASGSKDPKHKSAVEESARNRALQDRLDAMEKRLASKDEEEKRAQAEAAQERQVRAYTENIAKAATVKIAPLVVKRLEKAPDKTKKALLRVAGELFAERGDAPTPFLVLKTYEAELRDLGLDPGVVAQPKKTATATATKTAAKTVKVSDEEILRELQSGKLS